MRLFNSSAPSPGRLFAAFAALAALSSTAAAAAQHPAPTPSPFGRRNNNEPPYRARSLAPRQDPTSSSSAFTPDPTQVSISSQASTDPIAAAKAADALPYIAGNNTGANLGPRIVELDDADEGNNYPWTTSIYFVPNAAANGSPDAGWQGLPSLDGFTLNRSIEVRDGAIIPTYITANYDAQKIKRGVIVFPGKPRDSWKYTNLVRNALTIQSTLFPEWGVAPESVIIMGPAWMNQMDQTAGAVQGNELVFHGTQWQSGGRSISPALNDSITSYEATDRLADILFDQTQFPNLNQVVVLGHSMGGQMAQRYALLKKTKAYDENMQYWIGNPGSWAWLYDQRPYPNATCENPTEWHYGLGGNQTKVTKYARKDVIANRDEVVQRFLGRRVHYNLGLNDNGAGDTHCQAGMQGGNHLDRGAQFAMSLADLGPSGTQGGNWWPQNHTLNLVVGVSHQDYPMIASNTSLSNVFTKYYDTRFPDLTNLTNPGDKPDNTGEPIAKAKSFATPVHKLVAYGLLGGSIGAVVLAFALLPFLFPTNTDWQQQELWEKEVKGDVVPAGGRRG